MKGNVVQGWRAVVAKVFDDQTNAVSGDIDRKHLIEPHLRGGVEAQKRPGEYIDRHQNYEPGSCRPVQLG